MADAGFDEGSELIGHSGSLVSRRDAGDAGDDEGFGEVEGADERRMLPQGGKVVRGDLTGQVEGIGRIRRRLLGEIRRRRKPCGHGKQTGNDQVLAVRDHVGESVRRIARLIESRICAGWDGLP